MINSQPSDDYVFNVTNPETGDKISQARFSTNMHYYYIKDHLGDVRMIMDENGNPQVWNNYYPFGEEMPGLNIVNAGPDSRYQFTSKELDAETSLYYFGARYYDSWAGRFNSIDPHADLYHSWNPYAYSLDNPVLLVDQTGMDPGNNNNQGNQTTSSWNWQFGPNGTYVLFNTGSSSQQQQFVTLQESQEVPLAPNGFGEAQTGSTSHLLSLGANILSGTLSALTGVGAGLVVGGLFTEGSTVPEGALTLQMASYTEAGSFGLKLLNYRLYHVGNPSEIYGEGLRVAFDIAFSKFSDIALDKVVASQIQRGESELLGLGTTVTSFFVTPSNPTLSQGGTILHYVYPDVTSYSTKGW